MDRRPCRLITIINVTADPKQSVEKAQYWDAAYATRGESGVSWFQATPTASIDLINLLDIDKSAAVLDVGGGASTLVDHLIELGFSDVSVLDISETALATAQNRLGPAAPVNWLHEDILKWSSNRKFDLWHDRAVFHFLVDVSDRLAYVQILKAALRPGSSVIFATFAPDGPEYCSGLPVVRYSADEMVGLLGDEFQVMEARREEHHTPTLAVQPFTWVAARYFPDTDKVVGE